MRSSDLIFFGAVFVFFGLIIGFVVWYMGKKKKIHAAQEHWARAVTRLGGRELSQSGPGGTRSFEVGGALLSVVNFVFLENNIAKLVTPIAAPNSWQSQLTGPCRRPTPPFILTPAGVSSATGDAEFDARWTIAPLLDASQADVLALLDEPTRRALCALPAGTYQIASGGQQICAFREDMVASEFEVEALTRACALLAGQGAPAPGQVGAPAAEYGLSQEVNTQQKQGWAWRYSGIFGLMYGPIPVGIIIVVIGAAVYFGVR